MLLAAILSDTVILSSPTTTDRDRRVVSYLEELLQLDAREFGMEMFEYSSDVSDLSGEEIVTRDAKEYEVGGGPPCRSPRWRRSARRSATARPSCATRWRTRAAARATISRAHGHRHRQPRARGCSSPAIRHRSARASGVGPDGGTFDLPGVMSRKKQVAPRIMAALG